MGCCCRWAHLLPPTMIFLLPVATSALKENQRALGRMEPAFHSLRAPAHHSLGERARSGSGQYVLLCLPSLYPKTDSFEGTRASLTPIAL